MCWGSRKAVESGCLLACSEILRCCVPWEVSARRAEGEVLIEVPEDDVDVVATGDGRVKVVAKAPGRVIFCLLYTSPSPRD